MINKVNWTTWNSGGNTMLSYACIPASIGKDVIVSVSNEEAVVIVHCGNEGFEAVGIKEYEDILMSEEKPTWKEIVILRFNSGGYPCWTQMGKFLFDVVAMDEIIRQVSQID